MRADPRWAEIGASLRKNQLYVKMPLSKARAIMTSLTEIVTRNKLPLLTPPHPLVDFYKFFWKEFHRVTNPSLFYAVSVEEAKTDIEILRAVEREDKYGIVAPFRKALEAGLDNSPQVDWIRRVGGPTTPNSTLVP